MLAIFRGRKNGSNASRDITHEVQYLTAAVAQLVEQLICNQQVAGSDPASGFRLTSGWRPLPPPRSRSGDQLQSFGTGRPHHTGRIFDRVDENASRIRCFSFVAATWIFTRSAVASSSDAVRSGWNRPSVS